MVLEEAIASSGDAFAQDGPLSDVDPYSSEPPEAPSRPSKLDPSKPINYTIDTNKLPRPITLFGSRPLSGPPLNLLSQQLAFGTDLLQRRLTQQEVDALSYHFAHGIRVSTYSIPVGVAIGAAQTLRTRDKFSFPFWQPKNMDPDRFFVLRGARARFMWHYMRLGAYIGVGMFGALLFFVSYSTTVEAAGRATDKRLKDYNDALRERMKQGRANQPMAPRGQRAPITTQDGGMDAQAEKARGLLRRSGAVASRQVSNNDDDMSPTSGSWAQDFSDSSTDTGLLTDSQMRDREWRQQADERSSQTDNKSTTFDMNKITSQPRGFGDDASPSATQQSAEKSYPAGSAWEKIRKEAAAGKGQSQAQSQRQTAGQQVGQRAVQREQQQGSTLGDSFSFSETDEERQLAKSEAQKDFDARIERERHGGEFERGNSGRKW